MARLEWNGSECVNPPDGWRFGVSETHDKTWCWMAGERIFRGALYQGADSPTEAEAKRACEAALLRLGVLGVDTSSATYGRAELLASVADDPRLTMPLARALAALEVEAPHV